MADYYGNSITYKTYKARPHLIVTTSEGNTSITVNYTLKIQLSGSGTLSSSFQYTMKRKANSEQSDWDNTTEGTVPEATYTLTSTFKDVATACQGSYSVSRGTTLYYSRLKAGLTWHNITSEYVDDIVIPALPSYSITYNANGGSGTPSQQTKYYGRSITLKSSGSTRSGYVLERWNTKSDGTGTYYSLGATYSNNASLSLYAVWHHNPTCTYTYTPLANYYTSEASTPIQVQITGKTHYSPVTASNCNAYLLNSAGTQVASSNTISGSTGTLTITPPSTADTYTLKLKVWDNKGYIKLGSTIYSLGTVTVKENTPPICTATTTSSGNYYAGVSTYSVNITNATTYSGKTIKSIKLTVGSSTMTRTNNGVLSVTVPSVANQTNYTPTVVITDNMDEATSYNLSQITVYPNAEPTATYTVTPVTYYYGGASTYSINVTATTYYQKTLSRIELQVGSQTTSRTSNGSLSIALNSVNSTTTSTVKLIIVDNIGKNKIYNLDSITVYPNSKPSCTAQQTSSGYYYANYTAKPFIVTISNATAATSEHKTIKEIKLQLGNQSVTRTTNGTLSIIPNTVDTFVPKVTITDNMNISQSYNLNSVTIYENKAPTATITVSNAPAIYENTPVNTTAYTPYIITLSNVTAYYNKTIKNVTLTIGNETVSTTTITNGTTLKIEPKVAGTFTPVVVVSDKIDGNNNLVGATKTYNQTAITVKTRTIGISNVTIQRINAASGTAGVLNDEGTNAVIKATFSYSQYTGANGKNYLIKPSVKNGNTELTTTWYTGWSSSGGFTGPVNWTNYYPSLSTSGIILYGKVTPNSPLFNINTSYNITITPKSTAKTGSAISVNLAQAFYLLAGKAGGHALGIGKKPSTDGILDVGMGKIVLNDYEGNSPAISYRLNNNIGDKITFTQDGNIKIGTQLYKTGVSTSWHKGRDKALIRVTTINGYSPAISIKTINGSWDIGSYNQSSYTDDLVFTYITDTLYSGTNATFTNQIRFLEDGGIKANSLTSNLITVDQATLGDLVVNGNVSFVNARTVANNLVDNLELYTSTPIDGDTYIASYADGKNVAHNGINTYGRRPIVKLWEYIATKLNNGSYNKALVIKGTTAATNTYADANPKVIFQNTDASQAISLTFSDYDSVQSPASLTLNGNQGNEYFITPNLKINRAFNQILTGTGTAATTSGSNYVPAKWTFNTGRNAANGDIITIKIPVAGHDYGVFLSVNNGTNYYPVVNGNGTARTTTHFPNATPIMLVFDSSGSAESVYPLAGGTARTTVTGGVWRVINFYNSTYYYESCYVTTAAGTAAKVGTLSNYALQKGYLQVAIYNANSSAGAITLNINGTGAKPIYINGSASSASNHTLPKGMYLVYYSGTNYYFRTDGKLDGPITAGTAGTSSATSGNTIAVPYVTYNSAGQVTASGTHTHTITNNITGSGTSGKLAKFNGTNTLTSGPTITISTADPSGGANGDIWFKY